MSCLFQQNQALRVAQNDAGGGVTHARRPGMSCLFQQNRHCAQRCMARHATWLMHGGRS
jgi:hypothetical protein